MDTDQVKHPAAIPANATVDFKLRENNERFFWSLSVKTSVNALITIMSIASQLPRQRQRYRCGPHLHGEGGRDV